MKKDCRNFIRDSDDLNITFIEIPVYIMLFEFEFCLNGSEHRSLKGHH